MSAIPRPPSIRPPPGLPNSTMFEEEKVARRVRRKHIRSATRAHSATVNARATWRRSNRDHGGLVDEPSSSFGIQIARPHETTRIEGSRAEHHLTRVVECSSDNQSTRHSRLIRQLSVGRRTSWYGLFVVPSKIVRAKIIRPSAVSRQRETLRRIQSQHHHQRI